MVLFNPAGVRQKAHLRPQKERCKPNPLKLTISVLLMMIIER